MVLTRESLYVHFINTSPNSFCWLIQAAIWKKKCCNYHELQDAYGKTNEPKRMIILRRFCFCLGCECAEVSVKKKENRWQWVRGVMEDGERELNAGMNGAVGVEG